MKSEYYLIIFGLTIFLIFSVGGLLINNISGNSAENLTFLNSSNITRNISIARFANFTSAYINFSGTYYNNSFISLIINNSQVWNLTITNVTSNVSAYHLDITGTAPLFPGLFNDSNISSFFNSSAFGFCSGGYPNNPWIDIYFNNLTYNVSNNLSKFVYFNMKFGVVNGGDPSATLYFQTGIFEKFQCLNTSSGWTEFWLPGYAYGIGNYTVSSGIPIQCINNGIITVKYNHDIFSGCGTDAYFYETWITKNYYAFEDNKTSDFSSILNTALNNGSCDCDGCKIIGNNCSINLTFSSQTLGTLQYSDIQINYDPIPFVYLTSPQNATYSSFTKQFTCNTTDEIQLSNVTLYVWNSTGIYNNTEFREISGTSNSTTFNSINFSVSDNYTWNCLAYNNGSYSNWYESNFTLFVDTEVPVTTLNAPANNKWFNYQENIDFNCTVEGDSLDSVFLYGNYNGSYELNQTTSGVVSGVLNNFKLNLTDGSYLWTCGANKSTGATIIYSQYGNYTVNVDTTYPIVKIVYPINGTTSSGTSFNLVYNITDSNINTYTYNLYRISTGSWIYPLNISLTASGYNTEIITTPAYDDYNMWIWGKDMASNENSSMIEITTVAPSGGPGGGGGGAPQELEYPVVMLVSPMNITKFLELDRAIIYAVINDYCAKKVSGTLSIVNYYQQCSLDLSDLDKALGALNGFGVVMSTGEFLEWYKQYKSNLISQFYASRSNINKYGLVEAIVQNPLILNPSRIDFPFLAKPTISYTILANKELASCSVVSGNNNSWCEVKNTTATVYYNITDLNFFSNIYSSKFAITSYGKTTREQETRYIDFVARTYNLNYKIFGFFPFWIFFILIIVSIIGSVYFVFKLISKRKLIKLGEFLKI